jgi:hypothetical protein
VAGGPYEYPGGVDESKQTVVVAVTWTIDVSAAVVYGGQLAISVQISVTWWTEVIMTTIEAVSVRARWTSVGMSEMVEQWLGMRAWAEDPRSPGGPQ